MVLRGNICSSGFYSDDFHVRGLRSGAVKKKKKKGLSQTNGLIQSVRRSVAQTLNSFFFLIIIFQGEKK